MTVLRFIFFYLYEYQKHSRFFMTAVKHKKMSPLTNVLEIMTVYEKLRGEKTKGMYCTKYH